MSEKHDQFCKQLKNQSNEESKFFAAATESAESREQLAKATKEMADAEAFDKQAREFIHSPIDPKLDYTNAAYGRIATSRLAGQRMASAQRKLDEAKARVNDSKEFARE